MKRSLFAAFCLLVSFGVSLAQSLESFDIVPTDYQLGGKSRASKIRCKSQQKIGRKGLFV
jgi:hypothetical protein